MILLLLFLHRLLESMQSKANHPLTRQNFLLLLHHLDHLLAYCYFYTTVSSCPHPSVLLLLFRLHHLLLALLFFYFYFGFIIFFLPLFHSSSVHLARLELGLDLHLEFVWKGEWVLFVDVIVDFVFFLSFFLLVSSPECSTMRRLIELTMLLFTFQT